MERVAVLGVETLPRKPEAANNENDHEKLLNCVAELSRHAQIMLPVVSATNKEASITAKPLPSLERRVLRVYRYNQWI